MSTTLKGCGLYADLTGGKQVRPLAFPAESHEHVGHGWACIYGVCAGLAKQEKCFKGQRGFLCQWPDPRGSMWAGEQSCEGKRGRGWPVPSWERVKGKVNRVEIAAGFQGFFFFLPLLVVWIHSLKMASCRPGSGSAERAELPGYFAWEVFVTGCFMGKKRFSCPPWETSLAASGSQKRSVMLTQKTLRWGQNRKNSKAVAISRGRRGNQTFYSPLNPSVILDVRLPALAESLRMTQTGTGRRRHLYQGRKALAGASMRERCRFLSSETRNISRARRRHPTPPQTVIGADPLWMQASMTLTRRPGLHQAGGVWSTISGGGLLALGR